MDIKTNFDKTTMDMLDDTMLEQVAAGASIGDYAPGDMVRFSITIYHYNYRIPENKVLTGEIYGIKNGKYKIFSGGDFYEVSPSRIRGRA